MQQNVFGIISLDLKATQRRSGASSISQMSSDFDEIFTELFRLTESNLEFRGIFRMFF